MDKEINWKIIKAFHKLYNGEKILNNATMKSPYVKRQLKLNRIVPSLNYKNKCEKDEFGKFASYYERIFIKNGVSKYEYYLPFLKEINFNTQQGNLREYDLKKLIEIKQFWNDEDLFHLRQQILAARETLSGISKKFFKSSKYIKNNPNKESLKSAIKALLDIEEFVESDEKYLIPIHCTHTKPRTAIICENFYFLRLPHIVQENEVQLIYFGGYNISKIKNMIPIDMPLYYLCDWDMDGLKIYEQARDCLKTTTGKDLILITPSGGNAEKISETEEHHSSEWKGENFESCGFNPEYYTKDQIYRINQLIKDDKWIEEEGNRLPEIITSLLQEN